MNIPQGKLRDRITILQAGPKTQNKYGEEESGDQSVAIVWGRLMMGRPAERYISDARHGEITAVVHIRYRTDITTHHRLKCGDRVFEIAGTPFDPDGRRIWLEIHCHERS
jgi:SPP1 family predicted phage head-tail adaptor